MIADELKGSIIDLEWHDLVAVEPGRFGFFRGTTGLASKVIIIMRSNTNTDIRSIQISKPNSPLEFVEREMPEPEARQVRIKVQVIGLAWRYFLGYEYEFVVL